MIKPEDLPQELTKKFAWIFTPDLVDFLNAAIEAGVVSPPCKVKRDRDGTLDIDPSCGEIKVWIGKPVLSIYEHYRGQTK